MTVHTIIGASGLIGSRLHKYLMGLGEAVNGISRTDKIDYLSKHGHVYYCAGVTADFRTRPFETVQSHVCFLQDFLAKSKFDSFLYLSSTRVYQGVANAVESSDLMVNSDRRDDHYNISKLMGESICLNLDIPTARVIRLSNVIAPYIVPSSRNFFDVLVDEICSKRRIDLHSDLHSSKDYIDVDDVVRLMVKINTHGRERLYNLARGTNVSHKDLIECVKQNVDFDFKVNVLPNSPAVRFPEIDTQKIVKEFGFLARLLNETVKDRMTVQISTYKDAL